VLLFLISPELLSYFFVLFPLGFDFLVDCLSLSGFYAGDDFTLGEIFFVVSFFI
jgi:hypothetical protein